MKTIILAGGLGTRLGQMAEIIPKPMVKIGPRPMLWHILKIYSHFGYNDFIIALGAKGERIREYFYNFQAYNTDFTIDLNSQNVTFHETPNRCPWKVTLVDTGEDTLKGGRIKKLAPYLSDDVNMLTYGDGLANIDINKLVDFHESHGKTITFSGVHPIGRFGEFEEKNNMVSTFTEKPRQHDNYINGGFMVFNKNLLDHLSDNKNCDFEIGPMEELANMGEVMVYKHNGQWQCMDHRRDVEYLNQLWNQKTAFWKLW